MTIDLDLLFIIIIFFIFIVSIVRIGSWVYTAKQPFKSQIITNYAKSSFGMRCNPNALSAYNISSDPSEYVPQPCADGLTCVTSGTDYGIDPDKPWGFCKVAIGSPCTFLYQCEPKSKYCVQVCALDSIGGLNQPCFANNTCSGTELVCMGSGSSSTCKLTNNSIGCAEGSDCVSGRCVDGDNNTNICQAALLPAQQLIWIVMKVKVLN